MAIMKSLLGSDPWQHTYVVMVVFRIICNISSEDFIANIAMDIPSYISLNHLKYYVTYAAIVLFVIHFIASIAMDLILR